MLRVSNLTISLPDRVLIQDLSFEVDPGQVLALLGPSGMGKSTVLDWMVGLLADDFSAQGQIEIAGRRLDDLPCEARGLGLMTQTPLLFPHLNVRENLTFGARRSDIDYPALLASAELDGLGEQDVATLSGGQTTRVSLLRTLLSEPAAVLLDEPFSRLDVALRARIRAFVWERCADVPVVLVTHDRADVPEGAQILDLTDYACSTAI